MIFIIGAGISGLYCAKLLLKKGFPVTILEARDRCGGRIHSFQNNFSRIVEEGAEFIHGEQSISLQLIKEAGLHTFAMDGKFYRKEKNRLSSDYLFVDGHDQFEDHLKQLTDDYTVNDFLAKHFDEEKDAKLLKSIRTYVEGYDAADCNKASALALKKEWLNDMQSEQLHIVEGYSALVNYLVKQIEKLGGEIILNSILTKIDHSNDIISVQLSNGKNFSAEKVIISLPTGVLISPENSSLFTPALPDKIEAYKKLGYGSVIKVLLEFTDTFWDSPESKLFSHHQAKDAAFIFSEETIPTWWTQSPDSFPLLTGWLAGPAVLKLTHVNEEEIIDIAMQSLANIFSTAKENLRAIIKSAHVSNWHTDPYTRGAYGYETVNGTFYKKQILQPVNNKLFFIGEAVSLGESAGTVEAALQSAADMATLIN